MSHWLGALIDLIVFAQDADGGGAAAGDGGEAQGGGFDYWFFLPLMIILVMFYLMVVLPQRRKQREMQDTLNSLKENQQVVTIGGIVGSIVSFSKDGKEVVLRIDEKSNTKMRVLRSAISRPLKIEDDAQAETSSKELGQDV